MINKTPFSIDKQIPLVWAGILISCFSTFLISSQEISALSAWFMPEQFGALLQPVMIYKLWSPTFVHYTLLHLCPNLVLFWLFAGKVERQSTFELIVVFLLLAAGANISQWLITGPHFGGLSGVVYGLMAYLTLLNRWAGVKNYYIDPMFGVLMLVLIPMAFAGFLGKVSSYAHLGGLISGVILAFAYSAYFKLPMLSNMLASWCQLISNDKDKSNN